MRFALFALASLVLTGCSDSQPASEMTTDQQGAAREAYKKGNCTMCHGGEGQGATTGPKLRGLTANWDRAGLRAFLADPASALASDARLKEQAKQYMMPMQAPSNLTDEELDLLAGLLLTW